MSEFLMFDGGDEAPQTALGTRWQAVSDRVMGGVSEVQLRHEVHDGRRALCLRGDVRLDNNGGFVQMGLDLAPNGGAIDVSAYRALRLEVYGNDERYSVHLRTADVFRPWQSYRAHFLAPARWSTVELPLAEFEAHRIDAPFDQTRVRRLGIVGIGREFRAQLCLARLSLID